MRMMFLLSLCIAGVFLDDAPEVQSSIITEQQKYKCHNKLLSSYGLVGSDSIKSSAHEYCPSIQENCCTNTDEANSMAMWKSDYMPKIQRYYEVYLSSVKFILGYSQEGKKLAEEFLTSSESRCKSFADDFYTIYSQQTLNDQILSVLIDSLEWVSNFRKGFFCLVCDGRFHRTLSRTWIEEDPYTLKKIFLPKNFCSGLVERTIDGSFFTINYLNRYVETLGGLFACKLSKLNEKKLTIDIDYWTKQHIRNCFHFKKKYFFFFCERYCENFHLTRVSPIFDGNLKSFEKFISLIFQNRDNVFYSPRNNVMFTSSEYQESYLLDNIKGTSKTEVFFNEVIPDLKMELKKTDVVYENGEDLWDIVRNSMYPIIFTYSGILSVLGLALSIFFI